MYQETDSVHSVGKLLKIRDLAQEDLETYHESVLLKESVDALFVKRSGIYVDLTFGGGGHTREILSRLSSDAIVVAFDQDADAKINLPDDNRVIFAANNFKHLRGVLRSYGIEHVDGIIADLGVSSHHFDDAQRGFSFRFDAPLDMRMNQNAAFSALDVVNGYEHGKLLEVIRDYGELKNPQKIANDIIAARPIHTTRELIDAVSVVKKQHEDTKFLAQLFQSIRIEVNGELEALKMMLEQSAKMLKEGGRISIITYHSLEDRIVKNYLKNGNHSARAEEDFYGNRLSPFTPDKKVITPSSEEVERNPRARSAKLRGATKDI